MKQDRRTEVMTGTGWAKIEVNLEFGRSDSLHALAELAGDIEEFVNQWIKEEEAR